MIMRDYPWLLAPYAQLMAPVLQNRSHHALLIQYVTGSGENELIMRLAKRLLCEQSNTIDACQHCHSCHLFDAKNHPDFYIITNESGKQSIGVDLIRGVSAKVYEKSQQSGNKVIWIKSAGLMTEAASNALLKTLEEPADKTYFILSDDHNARLLPTIHSRCFSYFLPIPALDISIKWLSKQFSQYSENELATALLLNEKAPLKAAFMLEPQKWKQRQLFCEWLQQAVLSNDYWSLAQQLEAEHVIEYINWFCALLSDTLKAKQKAGRFVVNRDQIPLIKQLAIYGNQNLIELYHLWLSARENLLNVMGINKALIIHNLLAQSEQLCDNTFY